MRTEIRYSLNPTFVSRYVYSGKRTNYINLMSEVPQVGEIGLGNLEKKNVENLNKGFVSQKELGKSSIKKIKNALQWLDLVAKNKVYVTKNGKRINWRLQMITLTLSSKQIHSDQEITRELLGKFLNEMRNNYDFKNYVWKAETQQNGNIHYHIITDCGVNYYRVLYVWNRIQNYLGYVDRFRTDKLTSSGRGNWVEGEEKTKKGRRSNELFKYFEENPNSVDIKKFERMGNLESYITKYITKKNNKSSKEKRRSIESRIYSMSQSLSKLGEFKKQTNQLADLIYNSFSEIKSVDREFFSYKPIRLRFIMKIWSEFKNELFKLLKQFAKLEPSKLLPRMELSESQLLIFST